MTRKESARFWIQQAKIWRGYPEMWESQMKMARLFLDEMIFHPEIERLEKLMGWGEYSE
jgi:hypothetical protein